MKNLTTFLIASLISMGAFAQCNPGLILNGCFTMGDTNWTVADALNANTDFKNGRVVFKPQADSSIITFASDSVLPAGTYKVNIRVRTNDAYEWSFDAAFKDTSGGTLGYLPFVVGFEADTTVNATTFTHTFTTFTDWVVLIKMFNLPNYQGNKAVFGRIKVTNN